MLIFSSVSVTFNYPLEKRWLTKFPRGGECLNETLLPQRIFLVLLFCSHSCWGKLPSLTVTSNLSSSGCCFVLTLKLRMYLLPKLPLFLSQLPETFGLVLLFCCHAWKCTCCSNFPLWLISYLKPLVTWILVLLFCCHAWKCTRCHFPLFLSSIIWNLWLPESRLAES